MAKKKTTVATSNAEGIVIEKPPEGVSIEITASDLLVSLKPTAHMAKGSSLYTIHGCVLMTVNEKNEVWLSAYDGGSYIRHRMIGAQVYPPDTPWSIAVPAKLFLELVNFAEKSSMIKLEPDLEKLHLVITMQGNVSRLKCLPAKDFPVEQSYANFVHERTLDAQVLATCLARVMSTISQDQSRPPLTHVCVTGGVMASTNGFALSVTKHPFGKFIEDKDYILLPAEFVKTAPQVIGKNQAQVNVALDEGGNAVALITPDVYLVTPTMAVKFPDYQAIVPKECAISFVAEIEPILRFIKPTSSMEQGNGVGKENISLHFRLYQENDRTLLHLSNATRDGGAGNIDYQFQVDSVNGFVDEVLWSMGAHLVEGILRNVTTPTVQWKFNAPLKPFMLTQEDDEAYWVIMPKQR